MKSLLETFVGKFRQRSSKRYSMTSSNPSFGSEIVSQDEINEALAEVREFIEHELPTPVYHRGNDAAMWRLRKTRGRDVFRELRKLGKLAALSAGSLLIGVDKYGEVDDFYRFSRWKPTCTSSQVHTDLETPAHRRALLGSSYLDYTRLEYAIQAIGKTICLCVRDLDEETIVRKFYEFKLQCIRSAFYLKKVDETISYIKWLCKAAQAYFLSTELERDINHAFMEGFTPFHGSLKFLQDFIRTGGSRRSKLDLTRARQAAQISATVRALPYPSIEQIEDSINGTLQIVTSRPEVDYRAIEDHKKALMVSVKNYKSSNRRSHVSLVNSGTIEKSRSNGGRSGHLIPLARRATDQIINFNMVTYLSGRIDQFSQELIPAASAVILLNLIENNSYPRLPTLGEILYIPVGELREHLDDCLQLEFNVPLELAHILNNVASLDITRVGTYNSKFENRYGLLSFDKKFKGKIKFILTKTLTVKADVSIESALKTRLVTSCMASFAHLSQIPSNTLRDYFSQDPFLRVGFEEADKLWDVLKAYKKFNSKP